MSKPTVEGKVTRVSVGPTRNTVAFGALILAIWYAAVSQGNGAAYALLFFIVALGFISWLHARRNLRGLRIRAGRIDPVFAGGELRVPLTIMAESGNPAAGLEIRIATNAAVTHCGFLAAGESANITAIAPALDRGVFEKLTVEVSSLWPLGLFAARIAVEVEAPYVVHPSPAGSQALPDGDPGWQYDRRKGRGDGDEFAGLREFRPGESPRRIHWRAVERSGQLLIKEWEGAAGGLRRLDWDDVVVAEREARLSQLARWILDADRFGVPYGLSLPGVEISPGMGPAQRARCLQALAAFHRRVTESKESAGKARKSSAAILPGPFAVLLAALALAALPMATTVFPASMAIYGMAILFRFLTRKRGLALRSVAATLLICAVSIGSIVMYGGGMLGLEPGLSMLLSLVALKLLESRNRRDFFVVSLLTWFLALCGLFVSQTLAATAAALGISLVAAAALSMLYGEDRIPWRFTFRRLGQIAAQGIPLVALLFLFFPRIQGGIRFSFSSNRLEQAGFSEDFDPSNFAKLNNNFDTAFRAEFLSGTVAPSDRYWRGLVLWECEGFQWRRGTVNTIEPQPIRSPEGTVHQRITLQPHGARWLFALDRPLYRIRDSTLEPGGFLQAMRSVNRSTRYEVRSKPGFVDSLLPPEHRRAALNLPDNLPQRTRDLGASFRVEGRSAPEIVARAIEWFQQQGFTYSLSPQRYEGASKLDDFLFQRRTGFCAHYAGVFATLMRVAKVPARVVLGYQGGEFNEHGNYFLVRQNDAHAWCEVWIDGAGWRRVDLTQQLAPSRIETGAEGFRQADGTDGGPQRRSGALGEFFNAARQMWDNLNYQWDLRVVSYDEDAQFEFLAWAGLQNTPEWLRLAGVLLAGTIALGAAAFWLRRTTRPASDAVADAWRATCKQIARLTGLQRESWEGPRTYASRVVVARPELTAEVNAAADLYAQIRFGANGPPVEELTAVASRLSRLPARGSTKETGGG